MHPRIIPPRIISKRGSGLPIRNPAPMEITPAPNPFMVTITSGSFAEMFRVKLLSIPQNRHAIKTPRAPNDNPNTSLKSVERMTPAKVMQRIAHQARRLIDSLNRSAAIKVVAAHSKLRSSEAVAAGVYRRLNKSMMGAATPPVRVAAASHGISEGASFASASRELLAALRMLLNSSKPTPLPR